MTTAAKPILNDTKTIQLLPRRITLPQDETPEIVAFLSGAALAALDVVLRDPDGTFPGALLRDRLALTAAKACLKLEGRNETTSDIRDAVGLAKAGDALGPAGDMFVVETVQLSGIKRIGGAVALARASLRPGMSHRFEVVRIGFVPRDRHSA